MGEQMPNSPRLSDDQIVKRSLDGDKDSFGLLVERYWNMAAALAFSRIGEFSEAEDVAQEGFVSAYSHLHQLRNPARFAGWLSRIIAQECVNRYRRRVRERVFTASHLADAEAIGRIPATANPGLTEKQRRVVRHAICRLPEKFRTVVIMRFVAGLSTKEIARQLGKKPGTVRVWLHRAYQALRTHLTPLLKEVESS